MKLTLLIFLWWLFWMVIITIYLLIHHRRKKGKLSLLFKVGDRVEFHKGGYGTVIEVFGTWPHSIGTVEWDDHEMRGNPLNSKDTRYPNISISIPMIDLTPEFNPIIRKAIEEK